MGVKKSESANRLSENDISGLVSQLNEMKQRNAELEDINANLTSMLQKKEEENDTFQKRLNELKFYENLTSKSRPKSKGSSQSLSCEDDQGQHLNAKPRAAEEKRLSILNNARMRLAKLNESRETAKTEREMTSSHL